MNKENKDTNQSTDMNRIDYKDILQLKSHTNPHARMYARKRTGLSAKKQRDFATAIKRARFMALLPFVSH